MSLPFSYDGDQKMLYGWSTVEMPVRDKGALLRTDTAECGTLTFSRRPITKLVDRLTFAYTVFVYDDNKNGIASLPDGRTERYFLYRENAERYAIQRCLPALLNGSPENAIFEKGDTRTLVVTKSLASKGLVICIDDRILWPGQSMPQFEEENAS